MKKFAVFITLTFFLASGLFAQQKFALVIGNGAYTSRCSCWFVVKKN